jgi:hypothetical protein
MSIVCKKNKSLLLISLVTISCYSQTEDEKINVFFNLKDKALNRIYVNKDSTEAHFSIYVEIPN